MFVFAESYTRCRAPKGNTGHKKTVFSMSLNHFCGRLSEKCQYLVVFHASLGICFLFYMSFFVIMMDIYNIGTLFLMISYILVAIGRMGWVIMGPDLGQYVLYT